MKLYTGFMLCAAVCITGSLVFAATRYQFWEFGAGLSGMMGGSFGLLAYTDRRLSKEEIYG